MAKTISYGLKLLRLSLALTSTIRSDTSHMTPHVKNVVYEDCFADVFAVISWLVNSMEENVSRDVMMLKLAKKIWHTLKSTYGHEKNISRIYEI